MPGTTTVQPGSQTSTDVYAGTRRGHRALRRQRTAGGARIRNKELPVFTRALAAMLSAGLPLAESLGALEEQTESKPFKQVIATLRKDIESGRRFTEAMSRFPDVFNVMYLSLLKTGEITGQLAETLERLADYMENAAELRQKVQAAMIYPVVVASVAFALACSIMIWIVPAFERIYADLGGTLPAPTRMLIAISRGLREHALVFFLSLLATIYLVKQLKKTKTGAYAWDLLMLKFPIIGDFVQKLALCRFAESFAQMLQRGIPILKALEMSALAAGNEVVKKIVLEAREAVRNGRLLSEAIRGNKIFPPLMLRMLVAGEKTGRMDRMLDRTAKFYRAEVMTFLKGLTAAVEPLLIVVLGVVIGGIVVCMFIPIFRLHEIVDF